MQDRMVHTNGNGNHGKTPPPDKVAMKKTLLAELEALNKGAFGRNVSIESWTGEFDSNKLPKKENLAATIQDLYKIAKKSTMLIEATSNVTTGDDRTNVMISKAFDV